jgi:serine/threonine protein kinase
MQLAPEQSPNFIGRGGFGWVTAEGKLARKQFKKTEHLVRELVMLRYMRNSPYIVKLRSHNFDRLTICCDKWSCSLRDALLQYNILPEHKLKILKHALYGLTHMHSADLVHSDVTLANIFVNVKTWRTCLGDLGLSSIKEYSRVKQTAEGYAPENPIPCPGHDMFGLAVCMYTLFSNTKLFKKKKASELRKLIAEAHSIPRKLKKVFQQMCPDDPRNAITSARALKEIFDKTTTFELPDVEIYSALPSHENRKAIFEHVKNLAAIYKINRSRHCYEAIIQLLSGPASEFISIDYYDLYIVAAVYIYGCLYGRSHFSLEVALESISGIYTKEHFLIAVQELIQDPNFVALSVVSK